MTRARGGMTLIEVTTALVITGMMALVGGSALSAIVDRRASIVRATEATEHAAALRETIRQWIVSSQIQSTSGGAGRTGTRTAGGTAMRPLQTVTPGGNSTGPAGVTAAVAAGDEIDFTTVAANPADAPNPQMRLFVDGDGSTPETGLTLEYQANQQSPLLRVQLDASIAAITVEYYDRRTSRWHPAADLATITPRGIRITLTPSDTVHASPLIRLPIVMAYGPQLTASTQ